MCPQALKFYDFPSSPLYQPEMAAKSLFPFASFSVTFKIYATILLNGIAFFKEVSFEAMRAGGRMASALIAGVVFESREKIYFNL